MFTGIIETIGEVVDIEKKKSNLLITIKSSISKELKIDQSVSHNGVCLTVVDISGNNYSVVAVKETLEKTNLSLLKVGAKINLERSMLLNGRLDGHLVQGHIDCTAVVNSIKNENGSWIFSFNIQHSTFNIQHLIIEKGSICINGVSLTVVDVISSPSGKSDGASFSVAIIPYTYEHTNFKFLKKNAVVNIEFDVIGKYVAKNLSLHSVFPTQV